MVAVDRRRIHVVPALHISLLFAQGVLPSAPPDVIEAARVPEHREMTLAEMSALTWLLYGQVDAPTALAAFRDVYDYQTSSDVREVTHVAGSARGIAVLAVHLIHEAAPRRCVGRMEMSNQKMARLLDGLGCVCKRVYWES